MGVGFEEISIFLKERAYGQVGILGHEAVAAFAAAAFTGEHGAGALDVLMELHVLVDGERVGRAAAGVVGLPVEVEGLQGRRVVIVPDGVTAVEGEQGDELYLVGKLNVQYSMFNV